MEKFHIHLFSFDPFDKLPGTMPGTGRLRALGAVSSKQRF
jgi:hypothetical protein